MRQRTSPTYWPMRILLVIGIAAVAVIVLWGFLAPVVLIESAPNVVIVPLFLPMPGQVLAVVVPVVGLLWMIRIFRGPRDDPPPWRYRDR